MKKIYLLLNIKKWLLATTLFALLWTNPNISFANALQDVVITGSVTSARGETLPGVSILVQGTTNGTITDGDGKYSLSVAADAQLVFSYTGFETEFIPIGGRSSIDVVMQESISALGEIIVTALGIKREEKSLGYSVGKVKGEEFTRVAQENFLNSMAGKVAGVTINQTGGTGSTTSVIIRGAKSMSSDNQPLYVVDGVPMINGLNNIGGFGGDNRVDYGNAISDLDPESIESVSVLKGPSAAALYGTRAGNGVILITTKKARGDGMKVSITSNTDFDIPVRFLNVQKRFATGYFSYRPEDVGGGVLPPVLEQSGIGPELDKGYWAAQWNSPLDANGVPVPTELVSYKDNVKNFLNDYALTTSNGISISNTSKAISYRLGYSNMTHKGLIPNSDLNKNNLSLSTSSTFNDKLTVSADVNFVNSFADNRPAGNRGTNPLQWAYATPPSVDIRELRNYNTGDGNTIKKIIEGSENPWMLAYDVNNSFNRYQLFGNVMANWKIAPKFNLMGRMSLNKADEVRETQIGQGYSQESNNGAYGITSINNLERNIDGLFTYTDSFSDISVSASVGGNLRYNKASSVSNSSRAGTGLVVPNLFTLSNVPVANLEYSNASSQRGINSVYAMANLGWRETVFLDLTARNDWSSTLPAANRSYFYPSASLSVMINELANLGSQIDMLKVRGGWAQVGNDTDPYRLVASYANSGQWADAIRLNKPSALLNPNLKPEMSTSLEVGAELKMFGNRLRVDGTYYTIDNKNQIFTVPLANSTGYTGVNINAGLLQSRGVEIMIGGTPLKTDNWTWDLNFNFTKNKTTILELADGIPFTDFWSQANVINRGFAKNKETGENGLVGNLYTRKILRVTDEASPYYGYPLLGSGMDTEWERQSTYSKVGNANPDFILGLQTSLTWKNFSLNMTFDWRHGGQYVSQTYRYSTEDMATNTWFNRLVYPGVYDPNNPGPSQELRDWVVANADRLIFTEDVHPVGGPTPQYGGFPESFSGNTVNDGTFAPGVIGHYDDNGKFVLEQENLGGPGTTFIPYSVSFPWALGTPSMFDADYIKLREVSLSYRLPRSIAKKLKMDDINVSVYSRNIMLWTKDSDFGVDPERAYQPEGGKLLQGVERYNVTPWMVPIGFKVGFQF